MPASNGGDIFLGIAIDYFIPLEGVKKCDRLREIILVGLTRGYLETRLFYRVSRVSLVETLVPDGQEKGPGSFKA